MQLECTVGYPRHKVSWQVATAVTALMRRVRRVRAWRVTPQRWNHNIHYHPTLLKYVPSGPLRGLDVGCGEGILARELRHKMDHVTGIDMDEPSVELARRETPEGAVEYVVGDFLEYPFAPSSFDVIVSVATLHHMDARAGLDRMRLLLRPGGTLAVLGLADSRLPRDLLSEAAAALTNLRYRVTRTYWEHSAPKVWTSPVSYAEMRKIATAALPGRRFRRHLLWRYSIVWKKPGAST